MLNNTTSETATADVLQPLRTLSAANGNHGQRHRPGESHLVSAADFSQRNYRQLAYPAGNGYSNGQSAASPQYNGVSQHEGCVMEINDRRLRQAVEYIHQHIEEPFGVQELLAHVQVSRRWLEYAFRDEFGLTPYQYVRRRRLEHAGGLLRENPTVKIYEVAERSGFSSAKQLTTAFRQYYGMSPRSYRRRQA